MSTDINPDDTAYVSRSQKWHASKQCAGRNAMPMTIRQAYGVHNPCGNCVGDKRMDYLRELLE